MSGPFTLKAGVSNSGPSPLFLSVSELVCQRQQYKTNHYVQGIEYHHFWLNKPTRKQKQIQPPLLKLKKEYNLNPEGVRGCNLSFQQ